ncbi:hypothetical protein AAE478_007050 [Parahypoxylon ruwenzoriense]
MLTFLARHYSYECKASAQERPYVSRPSRTQQLFNPKLMPKLTADVPDNLQKRKGLADQELAKREAERAKKRELEADDDDSDGGELPKRRRSASYDSLSGFLHLPQMPLGGSVGVRLRSDMRRGGNHMDPPVAMSGAIRQAPQGEPETTAHPTGRVRGQDRRRGISVPYTATVLPEMKLQTRSLLITAAAGDSLRALVDHRPRMKGSVIDRGLQTGQGGVEEALRETTTEKQTGIRHRITEVVIIGGKGRRHEENNGNEASAPFPRD